VEIRTPRELARDKLAKEMLEKAKLTLSAFSPELLSKDPLMTQIIFLNVMTNLLIDTLSDLHFDLTNQEVSSKQSPPPTPKAN